MKKYLIVFLCLILCISAFPVFGEASDNFIVKVETKSAKPGDKVELKVELINNPGVLAMLFVLDYDDTKLKLTGVADGKLLSGGLFGNDFSAKPFKLLWNSASSKNFTEDGTLVTLEFEVLSGSLSGFSEITLGYKQKNIYDVNLEDVELTVENGGITIEGNEPPPQTGGGGGYTPIIKPEKKPEKEPDYVVELMSFSDVSEKDWFYEGVKYAYDNKLMKGVSEDVFSPDATLTRGMFVTILYRLEGEPAAGDDAHILPFEDVNEDTYYADAVAWAYNNKIISGISETEFFPEKEVTREQMAAIIYRYSEAEEDKNDNEVNILSFSDFSDISEYAVPAFEYAIKNGIINGTDENTISPKSNATRAQAAAIFMRLSQLEK